MKSIDIDNIKNFTTRLFVGSDFDGFLVPEVLFSTACTFSIDGHVNAGFVGETDSNLPEYREGIVFWKKLRPICYEIIKGKKVPARFSIILMAPSQMLNDFMSSTGISFNPDEINGLYLNIYFKQGKLSCTTGCSLKSFSMDRKIEIAWDEYMSIWLKQ